MGLPSLIQLDMYLNILEELRPCEFFASIIKLVYVNIYIMMLMIVFSPIAEKQEGEEKGIQEVSIVSEYSCSVMSSFLNFKAQI